MATLSISQKRCSKCHKYKPASNEFFHKNCASKDGLYHRCKVCHSYKKPKEVLPEGTKRCTKCKQILPATRDYFFADPRTKQDGLYGRCKTCFNEDSRISRQKDIEKSRACALKTYYKYREKYLAIGKRYRDENPEKWKEKNDNWRKKNPEKARAIMYRHISLKRGADGRYTDEDLKQIYKDQNGCCAYCQRSISWEIPYDVTVDHIQPLSRGGTNWPENIALACPQCNASKCDKLLSEWKGYLP